MPTSQMFICLLHVLPLKYCWQCQTKPLRFVLIYLIVLVVVLVALYTFCRLRP